MFAETCISSTSCSNRDILFFILVGDDMLALKIIASPQHMFNIGSIRPTYKLAYGHIYVFKFVIEPPYIYIYITSIVNDN